MFNSQSRDEIGSSVPNEHSVVIELQPIENDMKIKQNISRRNFSNFVEASHRYQKQNQQVNQCWSNRKKSKTEALMKLAYCYKIVKAEFNSTFNNYGASAVYASFLDQNEKVE